MEYFVPASLTQKRIKIAVVGAGGTGGEIMDLLTRLEFGLKAMGGQGIHVTLYDDDIVEQHIISLVSVLAQWILDTTNPFA